jgi:hypothetical protein
MKTLTVVLLLACLGAQFGCAQGDDPNAESKILALERIAKLQACETRDLKTLDTMLHDAFAYVNSEGRLLTKSEVVASVRTVDSLQFVTEEMVVRMHGDTAIVTGLYRMKGVERGKQFLRRGRFVDTWLLKGGRWVAIASLSTQSGD